jgi:hypothetical protein
LTDPTGLEESKPLTGVVQGKKDIIGGTLTWRFEKDLKTLGAGIMATFVYTPSKTNTCSNVGFVQVIRESSRNGKPDVQKYLKKCIFPEDSKNGAAL